MRFLLVCLLAVLAFATAARVRDYTGYTYNQFLAEFRSDSNAAPCPARKAVFEANLAKIQAHNAQGRSWYMAVNEHADMTEEEFLAFYTGLDNSARHQARVANGLAAPRRLRNDFAPIFFERRSMPNVADDDVPESANWDHTISKVLNQGQCGSCWAFATAHTLIGRAFIESDKHITVSTQQITSCTPNTRHCGGTGGCKGATFQLAADYLQQTPFLTTEEAYPYRSGSTGSTGQCKFDDGSMPPSMSIGGYVDLPANNKTELLKEVARGGPVAVSVAASAWFLYGGGVFDGCSSQGDGEVNHAVTAVGYDLKAGYLRILNSWGSTWGEKGYIRLKLHDREPVIMDKNPASGSACEDEPMTPYEVVGECGVFSDSSYPTEVKVY
jgi:cathepsin L